MRRSSNPKALLIDFGGTLVEECGYDLEAANRWLLAQAVDPPAQVTVEDVMARAAELSATLTAMREPSCLETPWPAQTRLIHDGLGIRFDQPMADLELGFWDSAARTKALPGAADALAAFHDADVKLAVLSNTSFSEAVIAHELDKHGLTEHLAFVMVSSAYAVRKPHRLLFEVAAARLALDPADIWMVGDRLDTDIAGAKAAGMAAVWLNPSAADGTAHDADLAVTAWAELVRHCFG